MNAQEYMAKGHSIDADGWIITLDDTDCPECPVAVHQTTGQVYLLDWRDEYGDWRHGDWVGSPLDEPGRWGNPGQLIEALAKIYEDGLLRVYGAIYGIPGASPLGAIIC